MAAKNRVRITVDGKTFTLVGYESEEHMEKVAAYIDRKIKELRKNSVTISLDTSLAYILTSLNVGDDYFKGLEMVQELQEEKKQMEKQVQEAKKCQKDAELRVSEVEKRLQDLELRSREAEKVKRMQLAQNQEKIRELEAKILTMEQARQQAENKLDGYLMAMEGNNSMNSRGHNRVKNNRK